MKIDKILYLKILTGSVAFGVAIGLTFTLGNDLLKHLHNSLKNKNYCTECHTVCEKNSKYSVKCMNCHESNICDKGLNFKGDLK